jgi:vesicle-fusing ATPase
MSGYSPSSLSGKDRNEAFRSDFRSTVGGLQPQIESIVRRVLDGRVIRPAEEASQGGDDTAASGGDETTTELSMAALEAEELSLLGLSPVRGLLLYGPPGCGKTALAREISRSLRARAPKIVSAPELLDRWVGGSEKLTRALFADAEAELAACNGDATKSALHVIVIDEIDAVFRKRSSAEDSGEATRSSVVNQILAKLDGVNAIPNVLMIGMTNRRELLDGALLRPGRLEVQIEIPLPNKVGRREIMKIHFEALRRKGRLSKPLCCAIDGVSTNYDYQGDFIEVSPNSATEYRGIDSADGTQVKGRKRQAIRRAINQVVVGFPAAVRPVFDLAADFSTGGFSGADIAGLVRCAGSIALSRSRNDGNGVEGLLITLEDVKQALTEVKR